jgi:dipeptidyl-peptidase-4
MKHLGLLALFLYLISGQTEAQKLSNELIWGTDELISADDPIIMPVPNSDHFATKVKKQLGKGELIIEVDFVTGSRIDTLFDSVNMPGRTALEAFSMGPNGRDLLIATNGEKVFRHSTLHNYYLYTPGNEKKIKLLFDSVKVFYAEFVPGKEQISFVEGNNIRLLDLNSGVITDITTDGDELDIFNGVSDWVYEEEFAFHRSLHWSSDGRYLAFMKFNDEQVPVIDLPVIPDSTTLKRTRIKYPTAGQTNPKVQVYVYDAELNKTEKLPFEGDNNSYLPGIQWAGNSHRLAVNHMNRQQNEFRILMYDLDSLRSDTIYTEFNKRYIELPGNIIFTGTGDQFLLTNNLAAYSQLCMYNIHDEEIKQLTLGKYDISELYEYDEVNKVAYFQAARKDPMNKLLYKAEFISGAVTELGPSEGHCSARFFKGGKYYLLKHSTMNRPESHAMYSSEDNRKKYTLEDNIHIWKALEGFDSLREPEFVSITTEQGVDLNGWYIKPNDFDPAKKYPVLLYMYGGPGSQTVVNQWKGQRYLWHQMLAQNGIIVASFDNRGTGSRGEEFNKQVYRQLGILETEDQIQVAEHLGSRSFIDETRIVTWGWSYGGYLSSMIITQGADIIKAAVAVAPVTHWKFYDTIYTERYMGTPVSNIGNYEKTSPMNHVEKMKGELLLIHGTGDDNVHYRNSELFLQKLKESQKNATLITVPDEAHSMSGKTLMVYGEITNFIFRHLKN